MFRRIIVAFILGFAVGSLLDVLYFRSFDTDSPSTSLLNTHLELLLLTFILIRNSIFYAALYLITNYSRNYSIIVVAPYGVLTGLVTTVYGIAGIVSLIPHGTPELYAMNPVTKIHETKNPLKTTAAITVILIAALAESIINTGIPYTLSHLQA